MRNAFRIIILFVIPTLSPVLLGAAETWEAVPLRTQAQKDAGMAGGEGMQAGFSIAYSPSNPSVVYFSSDTSGVWKSVDGGFNWEQTNLGFRSMGGVSVVVDPLNEDVVFVSGSLHSNFGGTSPVDGIYRTLDGGATWSNVFPSPYVRLKQGQHFVFDPNSFDGTRHLSIWAGTHGDGLLKSTDGGDTWTVVGLIGAVISDLELHPGSPHILYVAADDANGLYRITDDGVNPPVITPLPGLPDFPRSIALGAQPDPANDILNAAVGTFKVYKSMDGGQNFVSQSNGLSVDNRDYSDMNISPVDPNHVFVSVRSATFQPFYSLDGGNNWLQPTDIDEGNLSIFAGALGSFGYPVAPHPTNPNVALAIVSGKSRVIATCNGGANWRYSGNGYMGGRRSGNHTSAYFDPANADRTIFFLGDHGPAVTTDGGSTWSLMNVGKQTNVGTSDPTNPNLILAAVRTSLGISEIRRSVDAGQTWSAIPNTADSYWFMSFHPQDANVVYAGAASGSYISSDKGATWTFVSGKSIRAMFPGDGGIVYAFEPINMGSSILWRSGDGGNNWTQLVTNPFSATGPVINDVDMDALDSNRLYVAMSGVLWVFDGSVWIATAASGGIAAEVFGSTSSMNIKSLAADPNTSGTVYAGMWAPGLGQRTEFIYRSTDFGVTWQDIRFNLSTMESTACGLAVDPATSEVHLSTAHGNFVLRAAPEISGDIDGDGDVDEADQALFVAVLLGIDTDALHVARSDFSGDGLANGNDVSMFVAARL